MELHRVQILAPPLPGCVTPGTMLELSLPQFPHLQNADTHSTYPIGCYED